MQYITSKCLMTLGFSGKLPAAPIERQPPFTRPLPTTSCQHCKPYQNLVNLSIKKSPKTGSQTEQFGTE
jgi:hypothetical protein